MPLRCLAPCLKLQSAVCEWGSGLVGGNPGSAAEFVSLLWWFGRYAILGSLQKANMQNTARSSPHTVEVLQISQSHKSTGPQATLGKPAFSWTFELFFFSWCILNIFYKISRLWVETICFSTSQGKPCRIIQKFHQKVSFESEMWNRRKT